MPENSPYIVANHEVIHPLHFYAHSFLHAPSYTFVLYPRCTPRNSCYTSSTPTLIMTVYPFHCGRFHASRTATLHICALPAFYSMHPTSRQCIPVAIEIHRYCSPSPVRLAIHMHRSTHKQYVYR